MMSEHLKKVGDYRFIRRIGKGSTSQVFEAKKEGQSEKFAVKMIRLKGLNSEQKDIVTKEVSIIKSIDHPNIVHLYETFETPNNFYLVFQYCERGDLEKYLMEYYGPRLPEETAQRIIYCIGDAVSLIHSKGIAHRDIKLANILLKKNYQIKLADFGFARESKAVYMETYCGTPITMAPEIMLSKPYDKKVDIWSLGVITFQLIFGKLPFSTSDGLPKFMEYVTEQPLQIPSNPTVSAELKELLMLSLEKNPQKRLDIKAFMNNKWVREGSENMIVEGKSKKKPSVDELLRNISQQVHTEKMTSNQSTEIQLLVAQRVNKCVVIELRNIINSYLQMRNDLAQRVKADNSMKRLLQYLDFSYINFISNLQLKIGKQASSLTLKSSETYGLQFPQPLVSTSPQCDLVSNVVMSYLQKVVNQVFQPSEKIKCYKLAHDMLNLTCRFDIRVVILFANHLYQDIEVSNVIKNIKTRRINEEVDQEIELTKGNLITIAMECSDKDEKFKNLRTTLQKNIMRRVQELDRENFGF